MEFANLRGFYDQIRLLDLEGHELVKEGLKFGLGQKPLNRSQIVSIAASILDNED